MRRLPIACSLLLLVVLCTVGVRAQERAHQRKILVVLSSANSLTLKDGKKHPTGFFLNELGVPLKVLVDAGYEPVFSDPLGNQPTMDAISDKPSYFDSEHEYKAVKALIASLPQFKHPQRLDEVVTGDLSQYAGIFVPGGHAPMEDLWRHPTLGRIFTYFHSQNKPTALICHGPIALLSAANNVNAVVTSVEQQHGASSEKHRGSVHATEWPYKNYHLTVFSDAEETPNEPGRLGGYMKFYPQDALKTAGADVTVGLPRQSYVIQDRELITGQNPHSDKELVAAFVAALNAEKTNHK